MRRISFAETTAAVENRTKTVTRRIGWLNLRGGERLQAVDKIRVRGARLLCVIEVTDARSELLSAITDEDVAREGFPGRDAAWFIGMFLAKFLRGVPRAKRRGRVNDIAVTRIEFRYVDEAGTK